MPSRTALVIIDMQVALVSGAYQEEQVLERIAAVAKDLRSAGLPIIYVQHNHAAYPPMMKGEPGWAVHAAIAPEPGDLVIEKEASDAFWQTRLEAELRELSIDTVMIAGMQTEYCVDTTARSALNHGFDVLLLSDCHTTGDSVLSAKEIIGHHNATLPNVVHPAATISAGTWTQFKAGVLDGVGVRVETRDV